MFSPGNHSDGDDDSSSSSAYSSLRDDNASFAAITRSQPIPTADHDNRSRNGSHPPSQHYPHHTRPHLTISRPDKSIASAAQNYSVSDDADSFAPPRATSRSSSGVLGFFSSLVPFSTDDMTPISVFYYACGHMLNDLCAACWFTYLLVMLRDAHNLMSWKSAVVLLCGQVADAIATPLCGILSDRSKGLQLWRWRLERRQLWYVIGTVLVAFNFFLIFGIAIPQLISSDAPEWSLLFYYCIAASLFNVGWAAVQVSHMAMVPELSKNEHTRVVLNSARYSESVIANVSVFGILAVWSEVVSDAERQYTYVSYTTLAFGLLCSFLFLYGIREKPARRRKPLSQSDSLNSISSLNASLSDPSSPSPSPVAPDSPPATTLLCGCWRVPTTGWQQWLWCADFYRVGWVYMWTRVVVNVSQVFLVFYVLDTLMMDRLHITTVPCTVYVSSFVAALVMKRLNASLGRRVITAVGTLCCSLALILLYFLTPATAALIYIPAILLGLGNGTVTVQATQLEADLIGRKTEHGAFVYGALSFTDKLANGIALFALQTGNVDVDPSTGVESDAEYIRLCEVCLPLIASLCALVMVVWGIDVNRMIANGKDVSGLGEYEDEEEDGIAAAAVSAAAAANAVAEGKENFHGLMGGDGDECEEVGGVGGMDGLTVSVGKRGASYMPPALAGRTLADGSKDVEDGLT